MFAGFLDFSMPLWWTVDDVLSPAECHGFLDRFSAGQANIAPVIREDGVGIDLRVRNNTRVMWDDQTQAEQLLSSVTRQMDTRGKQFPQTFQGGALAGANPRLRIYRYGPNEQHTAHWDTEVELAPSLLTRLTLVVYLNDDFDGGATDFPELDVRVVPRKGMALVFQHRTLHKACPVIRGVKYVLRTDIAYIR